MNKFRDAQRYCFDVRTSIDTFSNVELHVRADKCNDVLIISVREIRAYMLCLHRSAQPDFSSVTDGVRACVAILIITTALLSLLACVRIRSLLRMLRVDKPCNTAATFIT